MNKIYIYRCKDNTATIYYSKEFCDERNIPVFEYDVNEIPEGPGVLKTDGVTLYREEIDVEPVPEPEPEPTTDDIINILLGVTNNE